MLLSFSKKYSCPPCPEIVQDFAPINHSNYFRENHSQNYPDKSLAS
jgi:hypothetical protein